MISFQPNRWGSRMPRMVIVLFIRKPVNTMIIESMQSGHQILKWQYNIWATY